MSNSNSQDSLYADPLGEINGFSFDENVVRVFPDMLRRSIPGYQTIITQTGLLSERYAKNHSHIYDLGCSLGATTFSILQNIEERNCTVFSVDNSEAMVAQCKNRLKEYKGSTEIQCICADIAEIHIHKASFIAMNFTLQFISPDQRYDLLCKIYDGMDPGGALILSEKICFEDSNQEKLHTQMYHAFKQANGYSQLEISQKRTALENIMIPDTLPTHFKRFSKVGFSSYEVWFQCFNFVSIIALK